MIQIKKHKNNLIRNLDYNNNNSKLHLYSQIQI